MNNQAFPMWHFTIGDPTFVGWLTVAAYFVSALLACLVFWHSAKIFPQSTIKKQKFFWLVLASSLFFLGINKQLDLQSYLTAIGRYFAIRDGWYEDRRLIQNLFVKLIAVSALFMLLSLLWYLKETLRYNGLAIMGWCLLVAFIAIRASSFHHVDIFINSTLLNVRVNWIVELSGIMIIMLSASRLLCLTRKLKVVMNNSMP